MLIPREMSILENSQGKGFGTLSYVELIKTFSVIFFLGFSFDENNYGISGLERISKSSGDNPFSSLHS